MRFQGNKIFLNNNFFVNSFHKFVIEQKNCGQELLPLMLATDKTIEAFIHKEYPILGIMFHPERKFPDEKLPGGLVTLVLFASEFFSMMCTDCKNRSEAVLTGQPKPCGTNRTFCFARTF